MLDFLHRRSALAPAEVVTIRERLELSQAEFAKMVEVEERTVRAWEAGTRRVPSKVKQWLAWHLAVARRGRAFEENGLEHCKWLLDWMAGLHGRSAGVSPFWIARVIGDHERTCPTCIARREWEAAQPPLPSLPAPWWQQPFTWLGDRATALPEWARPVVLGAVGFGGYGLLHSLPLLADPVGTSPWELAAVVLREVLAGAAAGGTFGAVRAALRPLGGFGGYVAWVTSTLVLLVGRRLPDALAGEPVVTPGLVLTLMILFGIFAAGRAILFGPDEA